MSDWNVRRGVASSQLLCQLAQERGIATSVVLEGTGITEAQMLDPATEIEARQELRLTRNLVAAAGPDSTIGLEAGTRYHVTTFGVFGFVMISSRDLRSAMRIALRFLDLSYAFTRIELVEGEDRSWMSFEELDVPDDVQRFVIERDAACVVSLLRELSGAPLVPREVRFRFAAPPYAEQYRRIFGMRPRFGAADNALVLDDAVFDRPLRQANELTRRMCEEQCRNLLARRRTRAGIAGRVRDRLLRQPARMPDFEALAAELHMSSRHLRRLLDGEGTSYRALVDEVRQALAEELLSTARLKLDDVAERLGYSERASFIHAFQRWKGCSPQAFRIESNQAARR